MCSSASSMARTAKRNLDFTTNPQRKRRRRTPKQIVLDRKLVQRPVLQVLDAAFLAPRNSAMFRRQLKRTPNPDGTRSLKRNPDIVMSLFKSYVRPVLRQILGNQGMTDSSLVERYFAAALHVAKKRRANHTQSWRLHGQPKPLRYGTGFVYDGNHNGGNHNGNNHNGPGGQGGAATTANESSSPSSAQPPAEKPSAQPPAEKLSVQPGVGDKHQSTTAKPCVGNKHQNNCNNVRAPAIEFNVGEFDPCDESETDHSPKPMDVETKCIECGDPCPACDDYGDDEDRRCTKCFDKFMQNRYIPLVHDNRESGQKERNQAMGPADRDTNGKRARRKRTSCKHCGSTTHVTITSRACPHNKAYRANKGSNQQSGVTSPTQKGVTKQTNPNPNPNPGATGATGAQKQTGATEQTDQVASPNQQSDHKYANMTTTSRRMKTRPATRLGKDERSSSDDSSSSGGEDHHGGWPSGRGNPRFDRNANVTAPETESSVDHFWAQVTNYDFHKGLYTIYFPKSGKERTEVEESCMKPLESAQPPPTRSNMINKTFYCDDCEATKDKPFLPAGTWKVRAIVNRNEFRCVRLTGKGPQNTEDFDVGFVMNTFIKQEEHNRMMGIFAAVPGTRSTRSRITRYTA